MIAIGTVGYFLKKHDGDYKKKENLEVFVAAAAIAGVLALLFFFIFLVGIHKKIKAAIKAVSLKCLINSSHKLDKIL